ncbi:MAG: hypothetical protein SAJ72_21230 [Jaaginema sp. PMC 1080.18]|nr:hypothetical protein [Jaaginema sp. PMC 1080.18]
MVVLLIVIGSLVALVLQNWSPMLPLVVFGTTTIALPLAVWISGFIAAGILTSLLLQMLNYRPSRPKTESTVPQAEPDLPPPPPPRREMPQPPPPEPPRSDWETKTSGDDWTSATTPPRQRQPNFEKQSSPPPQPPQPSERKATTRSPNDVYDANFRVINQPSPEVNSSDEEDWGFDDEELETEYRRNWPGN